MSLNLKPRKPKSQDLKPRKFTVQEYALMGEAGIFPPQERVELVRGAILPMSPQNRKHAILITKLTYRLVMTFGESHQIRVQLPLTLGRYSEPEPDLALVPLTRAEEGERHPGGADLVIEISDSSLRLDRGKKAHLYAKFAIPEYWIINLRQQRLEVRRYPDSSGRYSQLTLLATGTAISPLFAPEVHFEVSQLLGVA